MPAAASKVWFDNEKIFVELTDRRIIGVPLDIYPKLKNATPQQREEFDIWERGTWLHWEALDEDLSLDGFLESDMVHPATGCQERK
jgi:hypothetical protein